jgi:hypothetical protein
MQSETTAHQSDEKAVRDLYRKLMDGWNRGSGEDFLEGIRSEGRKGAWVGRPQRGYSSPAAW